MSEHALNQPSVKRLERSRTDKVLAGVSAGLGRYFDLTPAVFRLGFVVLTLLGGVGILVYIAAVLVMPKEGDERSMAEEILANRRDHPARLVALGLIAVALLTLLARAQTWPSAGTAWALVAIAALILVWSRRGSIARGIVVTAVTVLGLLIVVVIAATTAAFAWFNVSLGDGVGNRTYAPTTAQAASYHLGIGKLVVDLSRVTATQPTYITAKVGVGDLRLIVPRGAPITVVSHVKAGSIDALGRHDDGTDIRVTSGGRGDLNVDASVGAGHIEVQRAQ